MTKRVCKAKTKAGKPCKAPPIDETDFCISHSPKELRASAGFGGSENGAKGGRPPTPKVIDIIRERLEAEIDEWLAPLYRGREATRAVVVGNGPTAHVEEVADIPTQLAALREVLDRSYGRPRQTTEVTGAGGQPLVAPALPSDEEWQRDVARALQDLGAPVAAVAGSNGHGSRNGHG